jgi:purine catabolism regulator
MSSVIPNLRLKDLLRLTFAESPIWLSGEEQAQVFVNWVVTSPNDLSAGDLLIIPAHHLSHEVLLAVARRGAIGVLVIGAIQPDACFDLGDLPMAALPGSIEEIPTVQRMLLTTLLNQRAALMERGVRIHAQLSQLEAEGKGLEGLARAMSELSGKGILVQDKRGWILAAHPSSDLQSIWNDILEQLGCLESLPEALRDRKQAASQAAINTQSLPGSLVRLVAPIIVSEVVRGYLSLVGMGREMDALDHLVAEQGALVCAIEMARSKAIREAEKRLKGDLLTALLQEQLSPRDAELWAQTMGADLSQAYVAVRFAWDGPSPPSRRRLETLVNGEIACQHLPALVNPMGSEVVCFCPIPASSNRADRAFSFAQAVLEQANREYPETPARCGVGTPAQTLSEWRISFRQAGQALEMARRLGERKPLYYPDLSVYRLLLQIEGSPELIAFQEEILGSLLAHEGANELIRTLEAFFEHNGNLSQTAKALFIHRNTLIYRLERIAAITKLDLENPENRLAIQLALRAYRMRGPAREASQ